MRLILKADDFGSTPGVTDGIAKTMVDGIVRDTSFLTNSEYYDYALRKAEEIGLKACGLHLTLTYGKPLSNPKDIPSIVQEDGKFYRNPDSFPKDNFNVKDVKKEFKAQLDKFKESGLELTHIDSHHHIHALIGDEVVEFVMEMAAKEGVPVRLQSESHLPKMHRYGVKSTDYLDRRFGSNEKQSTIEHLIGIIEEYRQKDPDCSLEIMCHPGYVDNALREISSFTDPRESEVKTLTSPEILKYIEENNIELIGFKAIKDEQ